MYRSTKTYGHEVGLSACFRQWRAVSHCRFMHGYALSVRLEFEAADLDHNGWVVDFGSLKTFKEWLANRFDHKTLVAEDDPQLATFLELSGKNLIQLRIVEAVGCEAFAHMIYEAAQDWLQDAGYHPRVKLVSVEVREHGANSAIYTGADA